MFYVFSITFFNYYKKNAYNKRICQIPRSFLPLIKNDDFSIFFWFTTYPAHEFGKTQRDNHYSLHNLGTSRFSLTSRSSIGLGILVIGSLFVFRLTSLLAVNVLACYLYECRRCRGCRRPYRPPISDHNGNVTWRYSLGDPPSTESRFRRSYFPRLRPIFRVPGSAKRNIADPS